MNPLVYQQIGDSLAVFGSAAGGPWHPDWFYNILAHPDATVEVGTGTLRVGARLADPDERARIYARQREIGNFADYEKSAAPREIPVILLDPVA